MWLIKERTLKMIMEASKDSYPKEFGALLRAENNIIYEIALIPGTISGNVHVIFQSYAIPIDFSYVGSVHSHPSGNTHPSDADLHMFSNTGPVHIIVGYPYNLTNYSAYTRNGDPLKLELI
jgi:proteasome lid subunit RPN8/RPN11